LESVSFHDPRSRDARSARAERGRNVLRGREWIRQVHVRGGDRDQGPPQPGGGTKSFTSPHRPSESSLHPGATIYHLGRDGIREVRYEETEHYAVTKSFLVDPARTVREVFDAIDGHGD
jgi:hypothetical protein